MDNLRGSLLMILAMLCFAVEDVFIKALSKSIPPGQIISLLGLGGSLAFALWFLVRRQPFLPPGSGAPKVLLRTGFEAFGTAFFATSLALIPITTASAVIQATPLVVAMGGAIFLGQTVGWRRWTAIFLGLSGVLLILRPGTAGFEPTTLLAVLGMLGLAFRDLVTRSLDTAISTAHLSFFAFASLIPTGLVVATVSGTAFVLPGPGTLQTLVLTIAIGLAGYLTIVSATRIGDVALISSFRYSRMIFALILGFAVFRERPDALTILGVVIIILAGLYALLREARASQPSPAPLYGQKDPC